ncbi:hypothetical protein RHGRI_018302 [Rhododendron griersonianum]|uniref:ATP-dependent DNA helicase n=1 Tax=Rhododendron griersonianum TaxID=479676 RepID=A0AAV6K146_9ERIC|nr:hypothetical protein RHGRI_018302 [Rhododendron griersonianum]
MVAKKRPQTSYAQLPRETKDRRNQQRRELDCNLAEVVRAKRNERRRLTYAKKANKSPESGECKKAKLNNSCTELRLGEQNSHGRVIQSISTPVLFGKQTQEIVCSTMAEKTGHAKRIRVAVEATPSGTISAYRNKASISFPRNVCTMMHNGQHDLAFADHADRHLNIQNSDTDRHDECCEQVCLQKDRGHKKTTRVVCGSKPCKNVCTEMVNTMVDTRSAYYMNSEIETEQVAIEVMQTDEYCMQSFVGGVLQEVSQSSVRCSATSIHEMGSSSRTAVAIEKRPSKNNASSGRVIPRRRRIPTETFVLPIVPRCMHCDAKRFAFEPDGFCCSKGQISVYPFRTPAKLLELYRGSSKLCKDFRSHIRPYNNMFAFTSYGVTLDPRYTKNHRGIYTFRAQGQIYHFMDGLYPADGKPSYLQLYYYDTAKEVEHRLECLKDLNRDIITELIDVLKPNPYSKFFRSLAMTPNIDSYEIRLKADPIVSDKTFDQPTASQVALIWKDNEDDSELRERNILVEKHDVHSVTIKYYYGCYDPLQYPLLFPYGEPGWHRGIKRNYPNKRMTQSANRVVGGSNTCTTVEQLLSAESLRGPRDMHKRYLDAMTLVDKYGKPDIFLTMTCNPKWIEITSELKVHEDVQNRPDLVTRVFRSKFEQLKKEVIRKKLFGPVQAYTYVIEFQKRGLPHVHLLLILKKGHKLVTPEHFDQVISAEIPKENENPHLYAAVLKHMMHGPCGKLNIGHDKIVFKIIAQRNNEAVDEITQFQIARWVTPPEAMWQIYKFNLFDMHPSVIALQLHLENCQVVGFKKSTNLDNVADLEFFSRTMLTQFFHMNRYDKDAKKGKFLYKDFPVAFVWSTKMRCWTKRRHKNVIGRIVAINPSQGELYYLRLLLNHIRCPTSFSYLRTVGSKTYSTYREATVAHGLLVDDKSNEKCLEESCAYQMPNSLRQLFCTILVFCGALNPRELLLKFEEPLIEDYVKRQGMLPVEARQTLLRFVKSALGSMGKTLQDFDLDDLLVNESQDNQLCKEILDEQDIDVSDLDLLSVTKLNSDQSKAYSKILQAVKNSDGTCFFVDGPGGTGKSFLYRALLATVRSTKGIALATATSGVAASILPNGRTAHSRFKIPLERDGKITCNVGKQTGLAKLLRATSLIIWDEASMAKRQTIEALDDLLRDITEVNSLFGGKVVVLGGDFRQVLPVIPKGTKEDCIDASLVRSHIWVSLTKFTLKENMRARTDPAFSKYLLKVGNGEESRNLNDEIAIPPSMIISPRENIVAVEQLITFVFPDLKRYFVDAISMTQSAILAPRNDSVDEINKLLINRFPGKEYIYTSIDETVNPADQGLYVDFVHSICPPGMPAHQLVLKENCPIMMLRNLDPSKGLCNGTRLICRKLHKHVIMAEIAVGEHQGDIVFIPRISLQPTDAKLYPVQFTRRQFPVRLCFAMTINKAQGQTLDIVGVNLQEPVFSHGQLYVALSRATAASKIKVILENLLAIQDVKEGMVNWTVKAMVIERGYPRITSTSQTYQKIILIDSEGTKMQCTIWNTDIPVLEDALELYHSYLISNAKVDTTVPEFQIFDNPLQWTLSERTPIEEIPDAVYDIRHVKYEYVLLRDLGEYVHNKRGFDVLFAILDIGARRTTKDKHIVQNITIVDSSNTLATLVLWDQYVEQEGEIMRQLEGPFPVVQATRMRVSLYQGYQIATKGSSIFTFNPPIPAAEKLHSWCMANAKKIDKLPGPDTNTSVTPLRADTPNKDQFKCVNELPTVVDKQEFYWVKVTCKVVDLTQHFWYLTCSKCNRATDAMGNDPFWCNHCKKRMPGVVNLKFIIELSDKTGSIPATVFQRDAEGMFGITAEYMKENMQQGELSTSAIEKLCPGVNYAVRVKAYNYAKSRVPKCLYSVHEYDILSKTKREKSVKNVRESISTTEKPRKKTRRQLFVEGDCDASKDEDDLPLAIAFKKKKKKN